MPFFSRVFRSRDSNGVRKNAKQAAPEDTAPPKPEWTDAYQRTEVAPEEVQELLKGCTQELKSRGMPGPMVPLFLSGPEGRLLTMRRDR